ncbi:MAG: hypothetical protein CMH23_10550 [Methylophaga sp.]|nr:hypothetical protein [Methylophaga sp.]
MTMHTTVLNNNKTRIRNRKFEALDKPRAEILGRPARAHVQKVHQKSVKVYWESNATSDSYASWKTTKVEHFEMDGVTPIHKPFNY